MKYSSQRLLQIVVSILTIFLSGISLGQEDCDAYYPGVAQIHDAAGRIKFNYGSRVINSLDNILVTPNVQDMSGTTTCGEVDCQASGTIVTELSVGVFKTTSSTDSLTISSGVIQTLDSSQKEFANITLNKDSELQISALNETFIIEKLELKSGASLILTPGDYWVNYLTLDHGSSIEVQGDGTARLFVGNDVYTDYGTKINLAGESHQLFWYVNGDFHLGSGSRARGFLYSTSDLVLHSKSKLYGAANASDIELKFRSRIFSESQNIYRAELGAHCIEIPGPDSDGDGIIDSLDEDLDGDGIYNEYEIVTGTDPIDASSKPVDTDQDNVPDVIENNPNSNSLSYCSAAFDNGLQTHSDSGWIYFGTFSQLVDAPSESLPTDKLYNSILGQSNSCVSQDCIASGSPSNPLDIEDFYYSSSAVDVSTTWFSNTSLGDNGQTHFGEIKLRPKTVITFSAQNEYRIRSLILKPKAKVQLPAGNYWIENLSIEPRGQVEVIGDGTARIFVKNRPRFGARSIINSAGLGLEGNAEQLLIYSFDDITVGPSTTISALLYARGTVKLEGSTDVYGSIVGQNVKLALKDTVNYRQTAVDQLDFQFICDRDQDQVYDAIDSDRDGDGLLNGDEATHDANPLNPDSDGDQLSDGMEVHTYTTDPFDADTDDDGLSDWQEINDTQTDPIQSDSDNDGLNDNEELQTYQTDPNNSDSDSDGLNDGGEIAAGTNPLDSDSDDDGLTDGDELNTHNTDPLDEDTDNDELSDGAEINQYNTQPTQPDSDLDNLSDGYEVSVSLTDPNNADTDADNLLDGEELNVHQTDPNKSDSDDDQLDDGAEIQANTNPLDSDSDDDGLLDGDEINNYATNPLSPDSDQDELTDSQEINVHGTDPNLADSDGDGITDGQELQLNTNPLVGDSDNDGLTDGDEINIHGTDPLDADTDNDGLNDSAEVNLHNTNPLSPDSDSDGLSDNAEINVHNTNPNNADGDSDGLTDGAEINSHNTDPNNSDSDNDTLSDGAEINTYGTNPNAVDSDGDTLNDAAEINTHNTNPNSTDSDSDGLSDADEINIHTTNPNNADSDEDGLSDSAEVNIHNTNPNNSDSDGDTLSDGAEISVHSTNPNVADSDGDTLTDAAEINTHGTNPNKADTDTDGLEDGAEVNTHNTDPNNADSDTDGLSDGAEVNTHNTDPNNADSDGDSLNDAAEINIHNTNPNSTDSDSDGLSDADEINIHTTNPNNADSDGDTLSDGAEISVHSTNPNAADSDGDTLSDGAEISVHSTNPNVADSDGDTLTDAVEINTHGTDPNNADTDTDGLEDGAEVNTHNTDPNNADSDTDGLSDGAEVNTHNTDPNNADSDGDSLNDAAEINIHNTNPNSTDSDSDGLSDADEINIHTTNPNNADSDGDTLSDGAEISVHSTNPNAADSDGDTLNDADEINTHGTNPNLSDSDNDGYSDAEEIVENTDPNDNTSLPDSTPPVVTVAGADSLETELDIIQLAGTAIDNETSVLQVVLTNDQLGTTQIPAVLSGDNWTADMPLQLGSNLITIRAQDLMGNISNKTITVTRIDLDSTIGLTISSPTSNSVVNTNFVQLVGILRTDLRAENISAQLQGPNGDRELTLEPTALNTEFSFSTNIENLNEGLNVLTVVGTIDEQQIQRSVIIQYQPDTEIIPVPRLTILSPLPGSYVNDDSFILSGEIISYDGEASILINNQPVSLQGGQTQTGLFQEILNFPQGQETFTVHVEVSDGQGQTSQQTIHYQRDLTAPVIILDNVLDPVPEENEVNEYPYLVTGTIVEANLASFTINDQSVGLNPSTAGQYEFSAAIPIAANEASFIKLSASDLAGNLITNEYSIKLANAVTINFLLPGEGATLINQGQAISVQLAARIDGYQADQNVLAELKNSSGTILQNLTLDTTANLASGEIIIPPQAGDYSIIVKVEDQTGVLVSQSQRGLRVENAQQIAIELEKIIPANDTINNPPNSFISLHFNKAIDVSKLDVEVHETLHGLTYVDQDPLGSSGLRGRGHQLIAVNRDYETVSGNLSLLPGDRVVGFYPSRELGYDAEIFVQVSYDGEVLKRIQYRVRPLPTLISGGLTDQFFQPIAGMVVEIPALGRSSITNKDGNFSFGFGDSADANIAGGEYEIIFNPDMRNPKYGSNALKLMVDQGRHNSLVIQKVPVLNQDVNFTPVRNGQSVSLLNGALKFDLTQADLRMPDNRLSGVIHAQFTARSQSIYRYGYFAYANWLYTVQPHGVRILGSLENLDLELPLLNNARSYIPENSEYVLLLGLDPESNTITATGVGLINGSRVQSVGKLEYKSLNVFSIAVVPSKYEEKLKAYAEGEIDFASLTRELHIMEDEIRNFDENTQVIGQ